MQVRQGKILSIGSSVNFRTKGNTVKKGKRMTYETMMTMAQSKLNPKEYGKYFSAGGVSAVLEGANGKYYAGVNLDLACGLGFCAERNAASTMVTDGETVVRRIVCVNSEGELMTPCGSCREFLLLLSPENAKTEFLVGLNPVRIMTIGQLMPLPWTTFGKEE